MKQATLDLDSPTRTPAERWMCPVCGHLMTEEQSKGYRRCPTGVHFVQHVPFNQPTLEPPAATTRPRVTTSATETACAAAPLGPGYCDACGAHASELFAVPSQAGSGIAGLVVCRICGGVDASYGVGASGANLRTRKLESSAAPTCADAVTPAPTKSPAGPRSKVARIIALARALGVQSDAEAVGQLGSTPF